jgi:membrane protease YdiL (CAAX protease family)
MTALPQPVAALSIPPIGPLLPPAAPETWTPREGAAAPPGARYDHLARTANRRWYRAPLGLVVLVVGYLGVGAVVTLGISGLAVGFGLRLGVDGPLDPAWSAADGLLGVAVALPVLVSVVWFVERRRRWGTLSSVIGRLRSGWLAACLLPAVIVTAGATVAEEVIDPTTTPLVGWSTFLSVVIVGLLLTPLQAAAEEYVFRGWLVQAFGAFVRSPWPGVLVSAALFAALHDGATASVWGLLDLMVFAVVLSVVTIRTGGLEAAIAMHIVHNSAIWVTTAAHATTEDLADYSAFGPGMLAVPVVSLAIYAAAVLVMARGRGISMRSAP